MMEGHERAVYQDLSGDNDVTMEVNWNKSSGEMIRITINGQSAVVNYSDLYGFIFMNASSDQMAELQPATQTVVTKLKKIHLAKATSNIKKGDTIKMHCEIDVPTTVIQALKGDLGKFAERPLIQRPNFST